MVQSTPHVIIYSHGFGVRKNGRGLFTEIAAALPGAQNVMFDYSPINEEANTLTMKPLQDQALKLRKVINAVRAEHPDAVIDLVCHSQGCVVAGLVKPRGIRKVIMLAPPEDFSEAAVVAWLNKKNGVNIDVSVRTRLTSASGSTTVIHPEYWQSLAGINTVKLYNRLARFTKLRIIHARQDEVHGTAASAALDPLISLVTLDGNHNFSDPEDRKRLLYILQKELTIE